jgi:parvulin-like peptidyl-prolyl isomerase
MKLNRIPLRTTAAAFAAAAVLSATSGLAQPSTGTAADAPKPAAGALFDNEVVAKAKGIEIKRGQLDEAFIGVKANFAAQNRQLSPDDARVVERQVLERLIQLQILLQKATDADRKEASETVNKKVDEAKKRAPSEDAFRRQLVASGMDEATLRKRLADDATAEAVLKRELKIAVSDADLKKFYDEHPTQFEQPEMVRVAHVLIATKDVATNEDLSDEKKKEKYKLAEEVLKKAKDGADFAGLVKQYSDDPGSKERSGEYTFPRGQMVPTFEAAAFALKTNELSGIVTTPFGYHIIKSYEKMPAKTVEFEKVKDELKQYLTAMEVQKLLPDYTKKARVEANVEILDPVLKKVELQEPPAPPPAPAGSAPAAKPPGGSSTK